MKQILHQYQEKIVMQFKVANRMRGNGDETKHLLSKVKCIPAMTGITRKQ